MLTPRVSTARALIVSDILLGSLESHSSLYSSRKEVTLGDKPKETLEKRQEKHVCFGIILMCSPILAPTFCAKSSAMRRLASRDLSTAGQAFGMLWAAVVAVFLAFTYKDKDKDKDKDSEKSWAAQRTKLSNWLTGFSLLLIGFILVMVVTIVVLKVGWALGALCGVASALVYACLALFDIWDWTRGH
jgi:Ca2+/Na+ antiporter